MVPVVSTPLFGGLEGCRGCCPGGAFGTLLGPEATGSVVSGFPAHAGDRLEPFAGCRLVDGCDGVVV